MGKTACYFLTFFCTSQYIIGVYVLQSLLCFDIAIAILKPLLEMTLQQCETGHRMNSLWEQEQELL